MDSTDNAHSALDSIDTVAFKVGLKGYNVDEVDEFLERLSVEVRQLKDLAQQQRQQLRQAAERISQLDARGATPPAAAPPPPSAPAIRTGGSAGAEQITSMIAMAQRFIDQAQEEAEAKAREFTAAAQDRAREIVNEARSRAEDEVNRLNGLKQRLSEDVDTLAHQLQAERTRINQVLAEFTHWVQTSLQAGPAKSPSTPPPAAPSPPPPAPTPAASVPPRPVAPPPAPAPTQSQPTIGQVLKFEQSSRDDR
jgi:cell division initiation protein